MARKFFIKRDKSFEFEQKINIEGEEFNHIVNVLRFKVGDRLCVIDGSGTDYVCEIEQIGKKNLILKIVEMKDNNSETISNVTVFQALVKNDKIELIIQKLTELGVKNFIPFESEFCQVKKNTTRLDRLEKISIEALKQSGRSKKVEISKILDFDQMIQELKNFDKVVFAYENSVSNLTKQDLQDACGKPFENVAIIVGSEGGFSAKENEQIIKQPNVKQISMGNRILRAETASISLTSVVMFLLDEWERR
ncbi:MAG: RsmE family RNA methyltransferase [Christensenellales bacterium]